MSQKRKMVAAALMARMAAMAGPAPDCGREAGAAVFIMCLSLSDRAQHERGKEQRQVQHAYLEQVAGQHAALRLRARLENAREANGVGEVDESQRSGDHG